MTMANNRQKFYALAIYWLRDYSRNFGVKTRGYPVTLRPLTVVVGVTGIGLFFVIRALGIWTRHRTLICLLGALCGQHFQC
jgi:hypothetical protein